MNRKRIFAAVNLPFDIKENLFSYSLKFKNLPASWTKKENLHLTLFFFGYIKEDFLPMLYKKSEEISGKYFPFLINLKKICYFSESEMPPRMIWAKGEKNDDFNFICNDLAQIFNESAIVEEFIPHITLCRIRKWDFKRINPEEIENVCEDIDLKINVNSFDIMESKLQRGGVGYNTLKSFNFKKT